MSSEVVILKKAAAYTLDDLARMAEAPLHRAGAKLAIAFGSHARGEADGYADLDLVVVLDTKLPRLERPSLFEALYETLPVALDLLVYTPEEFAEGVKRSRGVFDAIANDGVKIYEESGS